MIETPRGTVRKEGPNGLSSYFEALGWGDAPGLIIMKYPCCGRLNYSLRFAFLNLAATFSNHKVRIVYNV